MKLIKTSQAANRCSLALIFSLMFALPQFPNQAFAEKNDWDNVGLTNIGLPTDLFPIDNVKPVTDAKPRVTIGTDVAATIGLAPIKPAALPTNMSPTFPSPINGTSITNVTTRNGDMEIATVASEYSCPLFSNQSHKDLIAAVDALSTQVASSPECTNDASATSIDASTKIIKNSLTSLAGLTQATDPSQVNVAQIETSVTSAIQATQSLGNILNNSSFLNSRCGRQTMSTGQALMSLNSIVNGLGPYALMAVSMNAALLPALPFVIGGIAVTSGISVVSKMYEANSAHMDSPGYRKALLQNTCQFIKVSRKVRFMQLAQSGQIDQVTKELDQTILAYKAHFGKGSGELYSLLKYKNISDKQLAEIQIQLAKDKSDLADLDKLSAENGDDMMMCIRAREQVNSVQDGVSFPSSAINNLEQITKILHDPVQLKAAQSQVLIFRQQAEASKKRIVLLADKATTDDNAYKDCAAAGKSWIAGIRQAINKSSNLVDAERLSVDQELSKSSDYRQWKAQYYFIKNEQVIVDRVEKAMDELAKDTSLIDRSELEQRMVLLKNGLFGSSGGIFSAYNNPPVLAWLTYTKSLHDRALSDFINNWKKVYEGALTFTSTGKNTTFRPQFRGSAMTPEAKMVIHNLAASAKLETLTLANLPLGSRQNEIACQQLETTWLNWTAALDHLGATQLYCNMIDGALDDANISPAVADFCRGRVDLDEKVNRESDIISAKKVLLNQGYQEKAQRVSAKIKELQCAMPPVTVMADK